MIKGNLLKIIAFISKKYSFCSGSITVKGIPFSSCLPPLNGLGRGILIFLQVVVTPEPIPDY